MVMKVDTKALLSLSVTLKFDDCMTKTQILSEGDYVRVAFNQNGIRKVVSGTVTYIYANPYSAQNTKQDWYFNVINDDPDAMNSQRVVKVMVRNMLDLEIVHKKHQSATVSTPNDPTRVTSIRVVNGYLQISQNDGHTWRTVNEPLSDKPVAPDDDLAAKIMDMIGSDQYANSDEFIQGIIDLIHKESRKRKHRPWVERPESDNADISGGNYGNPKNIHSGGGLILGDDEVDD